MKFLFFIFTFLIVLHSGAAPLKIVTSFSTLTSLVEILVEKKDVEITTLVGRGEDPHHYQVSLKSLKKIASADLIIFNGLGFEPWVQKLIETSPSARSKILYASDGILPIKNSRGIPDPHSFNSPENLKIYIKNISLKLTELLPSQKTSIQKNEKLALDRIDKLIKNFKAALVNVPKEKKILFTTHLSAQYLSQTFNIELHSILGLSSVESLTSKQISELKNRSQAFKKLTLFVDSSETQLIADKLKNELNFSASQRIFLDGLPTNPSLDAITVIEFNLDEILKAMLL